jgi:hypothetical protein
MAIKSTSRTIQSMIRLQLNKALMKATDYSKQYYEDVHSGSCNQAQAITKVFNGLMHELADLTTKRGTRSPAAALSCWKEIECKWHSFCSHVDGFRRDGLRDVIKTHEPTLWELIVVLEDEARRAKKARTWPNIALK